MNYDHRESLPYWIISTAHLLEQRFNTAFAPLGITFRQAEVMVMLSVDGALSQIEVARRMGIEAPTLAGIVARMEAAGWIVRESCSTDRRKKLLRLTDRVGPLWAQIFDRALEVRGCLTDGVAAEKIQEMIDILEKMQGNLERREKRAKEEAPELADAAVTATAE